MDSPATKEDIKRVERKLDEICSTLRGKGTEPGLVGEVSKNTQKIGLLSKFLWLQITLACGLMLHGAKVILAVLIGGK